MIEYSRTEPSFSLCGLNCCLCPRFHTEGTSRCPGCGGPEFAEKHPTCAVVTCSRKHGGVEFCFECAEYPCAKYRAPSDVDSFVSYREVLNNLEAAKKDLPAYLKELKRRHAYLRDLIQNYNDGKSKGLYCVAMNNLPFAAIEALLKEIKGDRALSELGEKERGKEVADRIRNKAKESGAEVQLRKR